ncbi:hypothetical protein BAUCODRAFT_340725 [Baudoinia panamericana UAMH 10762]|uniref:Uncharacterized protein n=1 Tax=Baudoinia panamericana (strain UAMH 10762) TaxID=717646 RepID=M2N680_BAUPA|nr:uncharacterized protein BAUCODRAFT_340725 [Baudoinia panamericana UAMH 10762]EMC99553.1 hypothetical protein BAUCODRAFT_340725 [Baudoinia panamericana UAMH 10762]
MYGAVPPGVSQPTPTMTKSRTYDIAKSFDEFWDDSASQKCMRVRCRYCGFVRAKNTTRQVEHLGVCHEFLSSTEGQQALTNGDLIPVSNDQSPNNAIWRGGAPNPNIQAVARKAQARTSMGPPPGAPPSKPQPSLASHLVTKMAEALTSATRKPFLSHAGCGTLPATALNQWLSQEIHISRALVSFVGSLIGKIRVPETSDLTRDPTFRALDLLCSAVNNMKKELEFLESTKVKYNLHVDPQEPLPATRGFIDLFASASSPQSTLLEGLVVLWATEHCFCTSFQYAGTFKATMPASSSYSLPSYLTPTQGSESAMYSSTHSDIESQHTAALHEAFIQNFTSANFVRFVSACKSIVDEVANAQTSGNGRMEMLNCERVFKQAVWLWGHIWPDVNGPDDGADKALTIEDDLDTDATVGSPYGGTGLAAIAAHNRASMSV